MFSVPGMCRWTGYSFHHSCSRAGYRLLQKCSQKGILFSNFCSQTGQQCIFVILCSQTGCGFLPFCSQTGVFKLRKMLPDRVKITAPQRNTPVHITTKCPPGVFVKRYYHLTVFFKMFTLALLWEYPPPRGILVEIYLGKDNEEERDNHSIVSLNEYICL